jgi:hypothetical protein
LNFKDSNIKSNTSGYFPLRCVELLKRFQEWKDLYEKTIQEKDKRIIELIDQLETRNSKNR